MIEFSETGNAAYIYERKVFEASGVTIRSNSFHLTEDLKRSEERRRSNTGTEQIRWSAGKQRRAEARRAGDSPMSMVLKQFGKEVSLNAQVDGLVSHEHVHPLTGLRPETWPA